MASTAPRRGPKEKEGVKIIRTTKGGRRLQYELTVLQQPERARACGSGAKSSADRRPVDPPPVVELHIDELLEGDVKKDITFSYEANFFLFATLENARPIAHGRGQPPAASVPVLTGMPVSGMAYLDRPKEAGYFIFPDLSVRHEGKYKLSFNLYEQTRHECDASTESSPDLQNISGGGSPDSSFDWRLEVKSDPFTVFSAKKFPGLAESTSLSRTVAEQGCRVRIRRDVRMRRRDGKLGNPDYDDQEMAGYERTGPGLPAYDPMREREPSRSVSNEPLTPIDAHGRRLSGEYPPPPAGGNLNFGNQGYGGQYGPPPPANFAQPQLPPQPQPQAQPHFQNAPGPVPFHTAGAGYRAPPPVPQQSNYAFDRQPYPQTAHPSNPPEHDFAQEQEHRRASVAAHTSLNRPSVLHPLDTNHRPSMSGYRHPDPSPGPVLPALRMPVVDPRYDHQASPLGPPDINRIAPMLTSPVVDRGQDMYSASGAANGSDLMRKRGYGNAFENSSARQNMPLHNHQRPDTAHPSSAIHDVDEEADLETLAMQYKRADGSNKERPLPCESY